MKQKISMTMIAAGLIGCMSSAAALAADQGFYAYVSAGVSDSDRKAETDTTLRNAGAVFTSTADARDTAYKIQVGYQYNRNLAVEGGYVDLGKYTYHALATVPAGATRDGNVKIDGWNLDVVGRLPVSDAVAVFGKIGLVSYDLSYTSQCTVIACPSPNRSKRGTPLHYGVGVDWDFGQNWFARAEYEVYEKVGEAFSTTGTTGTSRANVNVAGIGIGYRF
ncbi:MAG: outer membrane beta-barrel protein [Candidatus Ferrigenium altingense]|jgi:OOP family OmpA-OmpF porin